MTDGPRVPQGVLDGIDDLANGRTGGLEDLRDTMRLPTPVLKTDIIKTAAEELEEQLTCEIKAAYRMGYDYVHCYWRINTGTPLPEMRCYHSDAEHPLREFDDLRYAETYILREEALSEKARRQLQS